MGSFGFFDLISTLVVAVPTSHRWPMGDEGKQAMSQGSDPPSYPACDELELGPSSKRRSLPSFYAL